MGWTSMISHSGRFLVCCSIPITWEGQEGGNSDAQIVFLASFLPQSFRLASSWFMSVTDNSGSQGENYDSESHCCGPSNMCIVGISCIRILTYSDCNEECMMSLLLFAWSQRWSESNGVVVFSSDKQRIVFSESRSHRFPWVSLLGLSEGSVICRKGPVPGMGG